MSSPKVLISGSGVAGSVFAFWLLKAYPKANITIVERAPSLRLTGASVDIRSSAVDIIKWMGAEQEIRKHGTNEKGIQWVSSTGAPIGTIGATGRTDIQTITSEFEIFRGALTRTFITPVLPHVNLIFDETVDRFEQHPDGVTATLKNSQKTEKYDLLVAADGLGSRIRGAMLDAPPADQIYDEGVHVAYFTIKRDMLKNPQLPLAKWYNGTRGRVVFLRPDPHPEGRTRANLMNVTLRSDTETRERLNAALREGNAAYMDLMDEMFHDAGWVAPEVLKAMRESDDFYCSLFGQVRAPRLHSGRVVLLGDAGYATPGIGTSLAIMGGYVLAGELLRSQGDMGTALQRYEELLQPFVKGQQGGDQAMQYLNPQTQWGIGVRNALLRVVTGLRLDRLAVAAAGMLGISESKLKMPEYPWPEGARVM